MSSAVRPKAAAAITLLTRLLVALVPLAFTPVLVWLFAKGYLNAGGGEKDIVLALPWTLWSVAFAACFLTFSRHSSRLAPSVVRAAKWSTLIIVGTIVLLFVFTSGWLGVG